MILWKTRKLSTINIYNENNLDKSCKVIKEPLLAPWCGNTEIIYPKKVKIQDCKNYNPELTESKNDMSHSLENEIGFTEKKEFDENWNKYENIIDKFNAKDGGYGWIVLGAMFFINMLTFGYLKSFGVIFNAIHEIHPNVSTTMAGNMMGMLSGFMCLMAPFAGAMGNVIGIRPTTIIGTFIYCVSLIGAFFCYSPIQYTIVLGALIGLSLSFYDPCQVVVMPIYFKKHLSIANGIRTSGNPFGNVVYPLLLAVLLEFYGLRLTFILLAGITANLFVCSAIVRPWNLHLKLESIKYIETNIDKRFMAEDLNKRETKELNGSRKKVQKELLEAIVTKYSETPVKKKKPLDFAFFKDPVYLLFIAMAVGVSISSPLMYFYITVYAKNYLHMSLYEVSTFISALSIVDILMRVGMGALGNKNWFKMEHCYIVCLILGSVGCFGIPLATGFWSLLSYASFYSFGANGYHVYCNIILIHQFGKESVASTWGFVRMTQGICMFIHPTLLGYLIDATGGYTATFIVMGMGTIFSAFAIFIEPWVIKITKSNVVIT